MLGHFFFSHESTVQMYIRSCIRFRVRLYSRELQRHGNTQFTLWLCYLCSFCIFTHGIMHSKMNKGPTTNYYSSIQVWKFSYHQSLKAKSIQKMHTHWVVRKKQQSGTSGNKLELKHERNQFTEKQKVPRSSSSLCTIAEKVVGNMTHNYLLVSYQIQNTTNNSRLG